MINITMCELFNFNSTYKLARVSVYLPLMDKRYWDEYYSQHQGPDFPSPFAEYINDLIKPQSVICELGCGNGRDSAFFTLQGHRVFAVDQSEVVINKLSEQLTGPEFFCTDVSKIDFTFPSPIDLVYARFFLHALNDMEAEAALKWIIKVLPPGGHFYSESRSIKSDLESYGTHVSNHTFKTDHKRRFLDKDRFVKQLESLGFIINEVVESAGLATYKGDDPIIIRVIAEKPA